MSSSSNGASSPCKSKMKGDACAQDILGAHVITNKEKKYYALKSIKLLFKC